MHQTACTVDRFADPTWHLMRIVLATLLLQQPALPTAADLNQRLGAGWNPTSQIRVSSNMDLVKVKSTGSWRRPFLGVAGDWSEVEGLVEDLCERTLPLSAPARSGITTGSPSAAQPT
jgi:hypothetical protein